MAELTRSVIEAKDDRPFFLYFASDNPHRANAVLPSGKPTFDTWPKPNSFGNRPGGYPGIDPVVYRPEDVRVPSFLPDTLSCRAEIAEYYQAVSRLDRGVGRLSRFSNRRECTRTHLSFTFRIMAWRFLALKRRFTIRACDFRVSFAVRDARIPVRCRTP